MRLCVRACMCDRVREGFISCNVIVYAAIDGPLEKFDSIHLPQAAVKALMANLSLVSSSRSSTLPRDLGGVVRAWLGKRGRKEMRVLVEGLVYTWGLGQHTTTLASRKGNKLINKMNEWKFKPHLSNPTSFNCFDYPGFNLMRIFSKHLNRGILTLHGKCIVYHIGNKRKNCHEISQLPLLPCNFFLHVVGLW